MIRKFRVDPSGITAVEFSLVAPLFLTLVLAIGEFSFIFFTLTTTQSAVWDSTRKYAIGRATASATREAVIAAIPSWARSQATVTASPDPADATRVVVTATMPIVAATPTNFMARVFGTKTMAASATLLSESLL